MNQRNINQNPEGIDQELAQLHQEWLDENGDCGSPMVAAAIIWKRHQSANPAPAEGLNLLDQSYPDLKRVHDETFGRLPSFPNRQVCNAANFTATHRVFGPMDQTKDIFVIETEDGSVTVKADGPDRCQVIMADLPQETTPEFENRLAETGDQPVDGPDPLHRTTTFRQLRQQLVDAQADIAYREMAGENLPDDDARWNDIEAMLAVARMTGYNPLSHGQEPDAITLNSRFYRTPESQRRERLADATRALSIQEDAVYDAVDGRKALRVFPSHHEDYRFWTLVGAKGSVTVWDEGNGWCHVTHVETSEDAEHNFWTRLADNLVAQPRGFHNMGRNQDEVVQQLRELLVPAN